MRLLALATVVALAGCTGGSMTLTGDRLRHPISASAAVFDENHGILRAEQLEDVQSFELERTNWTMVWSTVDLTPDEWDVSDELNGLVERNHAEAVTRLTVEAKNCFLSYVVILSILPFWPSCADVSVTGTVVRRRPGAAAPPPPAVAAAPAAPGAPPPPATAAGVPPPPTVAGPAEAVGATPSTTPLPTMVPAQPTTAVTAPPPGDGQLAVTTPVETPSERTGSHVVAALGIGNCTGDCADGNGLGVGLTVEYYYRFAPHLSVGGGLDLLFPSDVSLLSLLVGGRLHVLGQADRPIDFWAGLSTGWVQLSADGSDASMSALTFVPALGLEYWATPQVVVGPRLALSMPLWGDICVDTPAGEMCQDVDAFDPMLWVIGVEGRYRF